MNDDSQRSSSAASADDHAVEENRGNGGVGRGSAGGGVLGAEREMERSTLARNETKVVACMKIVVFVVLVVTTLLVSSDVYLFTKKDQVRDFDESFRADAHSILQSVRKSVTQSLDAVDALSAALSSRAITTQSAFPNVSLPDFSIRASSIRFQSGSPYVLYAPLVTDDNRNEWEDYRIKTRYIDRGAQATEAADRDYQDALIGFIPEAQTSTFWTESNDVIVNVDSSATKTPMAAAPVGSGPYLPINHVSPAIPALSNVNALNMPMVAPGFAEVVRSRTAVLDNAVNLGASDDLDVAGQEYLQLISSLSQYRYDPLLKNADPLTSLAYPVFDSLDDMAAAATDRRNVTGVVSIAIVWRHLLANILLPSHGGILCVLENGHEQAFSYLVTDKVVFLGVGDRHDAAYDDITESGGIGGTLDRQTLVSLNSTYTLRLYPTQTMQEQHVNSNPFKVAAVIIMFTIAVNRRQKVVMDRAVASSAIVSSLFPSQVRDQMYHENQIETKKEWQTTHGGPEATATAAGAEGNAHSRPIAEVYHNTTIMFADLAGFTQWSSARDPVAVFELLETLYMAFDVIALRRKVFKVETIGDCYVAVAGLPDPQDDHAVIMTRFARDCMERMGHLVTELADGLGRDTAELEMRVGLHSGAVTGGVLRGQKSRFQLFGDTMNTASRMETTGVRGRIHVSQQTADELVAKGKTSWITPREDRIVAKGKGELQTYWVLPRAGNAASMTSAVVTSTSLESASVKA